MIDFLRRRLTFIFFVALLIIFFSHMGMRMLQNSEAATPEFDIRSSGRTAWTDARAYVRGLLHGELGFVTEEYGEVPLQNVIVLAYRNSMGLLAVALAAAAAIGLAAGSFITLTRYRRFVLPLLTLTLLGVSTPSFVAALMLQQGELLYLKTFGRPFVSMAGFGWDFEHMLLPTLVLAGRPLAFITRATFIALTRIMDEDYIRTAFSKGLTLRRTVNIHALRNLAVPVLTAVGVSLRFSLSTLPVVEVFFGWPGMGMRLVEAIDSRHASLVVSLALVLGLTFLLSNFLLDFIYRFIDPRLREGAWTP